MAAANVPKDSNSPRESSLESTMKAAIKSVPAVPVPALIENLTSALTPEQTLFRDKIGFVAGIANIAICAFWMAKHPQTFYWWWAIKSVILYSTRFLIYRSKGQQYYLLELCYYANVVLAVYMSMFPQSLWFYRAVFGLIAGPLTWSIVALNNALVLHSLDQMTSLFMHASPAMVVYGLRWYPSKAMIDGSSVAQPDQQHASIFQLVGPSMILYSVWAAVYFLKVFVFSAQKIRDRNYDTLYTLMTRNERGPVARVVFSVPKPYQPIVYMLAHATLCLGASFTACMWWNSYWAHTAFLLTMLLGATWNGASFYFDYFSRKYITKTGLQATKPRKES